MFVSGWNWKTKIIITFLKNSQCLSRNITIEKEEKKKKRKKERNTDRTQTKMNAPHVMYNAKITSIVDNSR